MGFPVDGVLRLTECSAWGNSQQPNLKFGVLHFLNRSAVNFPCFEQSNPDISLAWETEPVVCPANAAQYRRL
jgi:hypothetical protein